MVNASTHAVIVLGHGSRIPESLDVFEITARRVSEALGGQARVRVAYAELAEPTMAQAVSELVEESSLEHCTIIPLFLTAGRHVRDQIPAAVAELQEIYPQIQFVLTDHIGADPLLCSMVLARLGWEEEEN